MRTIELDIDRQGLVLVDIRATGAAVVLQRIEAIGGVVTNSVPAYRAVRARVPLDRVEELGVLPQVQFVAPADQMITNRQRVVRVADPFITQKDNTSEGDVAHKADQAAGDA